MVDAFSRLLKYESSRHITQASKQGSSLDAPSKYVKLLLAGKRLCRSRAVGMRQPRLGERVRAIGQVFAAYLKRANGTVRAVARALNTVQSVLCGAHKWQPGSLRLSRTLEESLAELDEDRTRARTNFEAEPSSAVCCTAAADT